MSRQIEIERESGNVLNTKQAAALTGVCSRTLRNYRQQGTGPVYVRLQSGAVRYLRRDLLAWLEWLRVVPECTADTTTVPPPTKETP